MRSTTQHFLIDKPTTLFSNPAIRFEKIPRRFFLNEGSLEGIEITLFDDIFIMPSRSGIQAVGFWHKAMMAYYGIDYDSIYCIIDERSIKAEVSTCSEGRNPMTFLQSPCGNKTREVHDDFDYSTELGIVVFTFPYALRDREHVEIEVLAGERRQQFSLVPPALSNHNFAIQTMIRSAPNRKLLLREWLDYHLLVGADAFYIYDNGISCDDLELLSSYKEVVVIEWNKTAHHWHEYDQAGTKFKLIPMTQSQAATHCLLRYGKTAQCQWIGYIDIDEFIVAESSTVLDVLNSVTADSAVGGLFLSQYVFFEKSPERVKSVIRDCTTRAKMKRTRHKLLLKPTHFDMVFVHWARQIASPYQVVHELDVRTLRLNHYRHIFLNFCKEPAKDDELIRDCHLAKSYGENFPIESE